MATDGPVVDFATDWDHTDPTWVNNPYPIWEDLRQNCPVAHTERYGPAWFPVTHEMVSEIANDTTNYTSRQVVINKTPMDELPNLAPAPIGGAPPITSDPPFHHFARRVMLPALAPGVVNALEPQVRALCRKYLDLIKDKTEFNAGHDFAQYISPGVIRVMLGFPEEDEDTFRALTHHILGSVDKSQEDRREMNEFFEQYLTTQIEDHVANPREDFTNYLLNTDFNGEKLTMQHVRGTIGLTLIAGIDTTWSAIGSSLWHLAHHPDDLARLVAEPDLLNVAVEEFLRFYAPVTMARRVAQDHEFHGCPMKKDDWVLLGFPAANRDPSVFKDADKFIIDRAENRHVAFGLGIHRCAGSNLARMELRIAIEEFIKTFPKFELSDPSAVTWEPGQVRGPRSIPVRIPS
jgi:cytochrome P450